MAGEQWFRAEGPQGLRCAESGAEGVVPTGYCRPLVRLLREADDEIINKGSGRGLQTCHFQAFLDLCDMKDTKGL